ncbi:MAG: 30S ribosomal protein S6 [Clostridia bacterium]|nr:30S ribosomal protein S6 [Clostridia bacterium]
MTKYEMLYIISPKADEATREALIERFQSVVTTAGGTAEVNKWGMRKLAYKINFLSEGYYVLMNYTAPATVPAELERQMRITDTIMRFVTIKKVENKLTKAEDERKAKVAERAAAAQKAREEAAEKAVAEEAKVAEVAEEPAPAVVEESVQPEAQDVAE